MDPFAPFKAAQREAWASFLPVESATTIPAARLVKLARLTPGDRVLDVACGTGVVAVTAARVGARVCALDLSPVLLERARKNAATAGHEIAFIEGDAEALPYPDASFDVVVSQFGHMFAPRPAVVLAEMLRVLKVGGRIAFSTWPPELFMGGVFAMVGRYMPAPSPGAPVPVPPMSWGDPSVVRERLGDAVRDVLFERDAMIVPTLSPAHLRVAQEATIAPLAKLVESLQGDPAKLARLRAEYEAMAADLFEDNFIRYHYLMTRAIKV